MVKFNFKELKIGHISNSSGIFYGQNIQVNWKHTSKVNDGHGTISGENNNLNKNLNATIDNDKYDNLQVRPKKQ
jgi:hypothetical protein